MIITCPACFQTGNQNNFPYLGNQYSKCGFCSTILENAALCPKCDDIMIAKHTMISKMFPLFAVISTFTGNLIVSCRSCKYTGKKSEFRNVYMYDGNVCIAMHEVKLKSIHYYFYDYYNGFRLTTLDEMFRCNVIAFELIIELENDEQPELIWPVLEVTSSNVNIIIPPSLANNGDFGNSPLRNITSHKYGRKYELADCLHIFLYLNPFKNSDLVEAYLNSDIELYLKKLRYRIINSVTILEINVNKKIDPRISFLNQ